MIGFALCRRDDGQAIYFSAKRIAAASAFGSWSTDAHKALCFARAVDATDFAKLALPTEEPFLSAVPMSSLL